MWLKRAEGGLAALARRGHCIALSINCGDMEGEHVAALVNI